MKKKVISTLSALVLGAFLTACSGGEQKETTAAPAAKTGSLSQVDNLPEPADAEGAETWSVYWYLCGSDLESNLGFATKDMEEMLSVRLPKNVQVIIETGGATE